MDKSASSGSNLYSWSDCKFCDVYSDPCANEFAVKPRGRSKFSESVNILSGPDFDIFSTVRWLGSSSF